MRLKIGKFYRARGGHIVGIVGDSGNRQFPFWDGRHSYCEDGRFVMAGETPNDLVEELPSPKYEEQTGAVTRAVNLADLGMGLPEDRAARKEYPMYSGLFAYFPDALAEVAHLSFISNEVHNPGEPLHWSKDKSNDHLDCIVRHLSQVGSLDAANRNVRHSAQLAWRALANLQIEIEKDRAKALG